MGDRKNTEEMIIGALDSLVRKNGFKGLGINSVAKEAGISKVLIYRYFESFEGLLEIWALRNSYWTGDSTSFPDEVNMNDLGTSILTGYGSSLMANPVKREVLRWLITEHSEVGQKVMRKLEEKGLILTKNFMDRVNIKENIDVDALVCILTAGISYLALLSDRADVYNGVELNTEEGWKRIENVINSLLAKVME